MATATETLSGPKLWLRALYTIPRVNPSEVDPISRWLILGRVSVVVMTAISAVIGGLLAVRDDVFSLPLLILVALGLVLAHTGSNLVNDFWDFRHAIDTPASRQSRSSRGTTADARPPAASTRGGTRPTPLPFSAYTADYAYVISDLRRVGLVIGSLLLILIVLYFVLPH